MSVVAEDPTMVKYLLDQGVDIHERSSSDRCDINTKKSSNKNTCRCYGSFFCPEDQKPSRNDSLDHELVDVCLKSNYQG